MWQTSFEHGINSLPFSCFRRYRNFSTLSIAIPRLAFGRAWYCDTVCGYSRIRVSKQGVTDNIGQPYNGTGLYMTPLFVSNTLYQFICFMVLGSLITAHDCIWHHCLFRASYPNFYLVVLGSLIMAHDCIWQTPLFVSDIISQFLCFYGLSICEQSKYILPFDTSVMHFVPKWLPWKSLYSNGFGDVQLSLKLHCLRLLWDIAQDNDKRRFFKSLDLMVLFASRQWYSDSTSAYYFHVP